MCTRKPNNPGTRYLACHWSLPEYLHLSAAKGQCDNSRIFHSLSDPSDPADSTYVMQNHDAACESEASNTHIRNVEKPIEQHNQDIYIYITTRYREQGDERSY